MRQKLSTALNAWHPSDNSAKLMLQPWINVFQQGYMEAFLIKNIVPKLQAALHVFVINPHHQQLGNIFKNNIEKFKLRKKIVFFV